MLQGAGAFVGFGDPTGQHDSFQSSHISPVIINFMNINYGVAFSRARGQAGGVHFGVLWRLTFQTQRQSLHISPVGLYNDSCTVQYTVRDSTQS